MSELWHYFPLTFLKEEFLKAYPFAHRKIISFHQGDDIFLEKNGTVAFSQPLRAGMT